MVTFWVHQKVLPRHNGYHGPALLATQVTTQGGLVSPILFNALIYNVIRTYLVLTVEDHWVALDRVGDNVNCCRGVCYDDYGMVSSRDSDWLQHLMNFLIGFFWRYSLVSNFAKSHMMTFQPGALRLWMSEEARECKCVGVVSSYHERLWQQIPLPECGVKITAGLMIAHRRQIHGTEMAIDWNRLPVSETEYHPQVYNVRFPLEKKRCPQPIPRCPVSSPTFTSLLNHFIIHH